jgi:hypothetical protein
MCTVHPDANHTVKFPPAKYRAASLHTPCSRRARLALTLGMVSDVMTCLLKSCRHQQDITQQVQKQLGLRALRAWTLIRLQPGGCATACCCLLLVPMSGF